jgi:lipopolysaccharide transport system permease protein
MNQIEESVAKNGHVELDSMDAPLNHRLANFDSTEVNHTESAMMPDLDLPLTRIKPASGWHIIDFRELWRFRELLYFLTWRDVKVRYKQTALGAAWAILQPLCMMIVFSMFLGRLAKSDAIDIPYPLFVLAGLLPWTFFGNSVSNSGQSVVVNERLVTKIYFPRIIIPLASIGAGLVDFVIALGLLGVMMIYYMLFRDVHTGWMILLLPVPMLGMLIAALGTGSLLAALTVAYRDFRHAVPFVMQVWMFGTPSIYMPMSTLSESRWAAWLPINPAFGFVQNFRLALLGQPLDWYSLAISGAVSVVLLFLGCLYFRRVEHQFADII